MKKLIHKYDDGSNVEANSSFTIQKRGTKLAEVIDVTGKTNAQIRAIKRRKPKKLTSK